MTDRTDVSRRVFLKSTGICPVLALAPTVLAGAKLFLEPQAEPALGKHRTGRAP